MKLNSKKKRTFYYFFITSIIFMMILTGCAIPESRSSGGGSSKNEDTDEFISDPIESFDDLANRICNSSIKVTVNQADNFLIPLYDVGELGKWVFCDYYTDSIDEITSSYTIGEADINDWGAEIWGDGTPELGHKVSGIYDRTVRFIFYVDGMNKFHVYEFLEYGSDYSGKNVWFGDSHIFYLDPINNGDIAIGAPYLELFPDLANNNILEIRIEKTSYYKYRGLYAGNHNISEDPGSTLQEMTDTLGEPIATFSVPTMDDIGWDDYNKFFIFDGGEGGYIHYIDVDNSINARFFLRKLSDNNYHIIAIYMRDFQENNDFPYTYYDDVRDKDLSFYDLRYKSDILFTLYFSTETSWPVSDMMPPDFNSNNILEYGKYPGLGIQALHNSGHKGDGVNIAYVDQPLLVGHEAYNNVDLHYYKIREDEPSMDSSMHGPAVLSLLAGNEIGIAPDASVYFFGHPAWLGDQRTHAEALYELIAINDTLPVEQKIRIVGFSDAPDSREDYIEDYQNAIIAAENADIMVIDVTTLKIVPLTIMPDKDKDNYQNYEVANWAKEWEPSQTECFYVPTSGRTVAVGYLTDKYDKYDYTQNGGLSWAIPYIVGVITLGLEIDPDLTKEDALDYLYNSGNNFRNGRIINPSGFLNMVNANK